MKNIKYLVTNIIILIILVLILFSCQRKNIYESGIDVFNININDMKDNCKVTNNEVIINDDYGNYVYQYDLNIFKNTVFKDNKIAPGMTGTYLFNVHNNSKMDIKYSILMNKISKYDINLKYRLKKNNKYIIGNKNTWVTVNELNTRELLLTHNNTDKYTLEWTWFDNDDLDSYIGSNMTSKYLLNISFNLKEVDSL